MKTMPERLYSNVCVDCRRRTPLKTLYVRYDARKQDYDQSVKNMIDLAASVKSIFRNGLFVVILPARQIVISVSVLVPADTAIQMSNANELD